MLPFFVILPPELRQHNGGIAFGYKDYTTSLYPSQSPLSCRVVFFIKTARRFLYHQVGKDLAEILVSCIYAMYDVFRTVDCLDGVLIEGRSLNAGGRGYGFLGDTHQPPLIEIGK